MIKHDSSFFSLFRKVSVLILAFSLFAGLASGYQLHVDSEIPITSLMRVSCIQNVSIVSQVSVLLLPFLFSVFFSSTRAAWMVLPVSFLKGLCFGFSQATICSSFAGAGWLIYFFLMFSNIISLPVLIFFWIRILNRNEHIIPLFLYCVITVLFIIAFDHHFINPYCISLFT